MKKASILIVEDEIVIAANLKSKLEKRNFYVCEIAKSGEGALKIIRQEIPDLIIMDIKIKGSMDGIETSKRIKELWDIPIIFQSDYSDKEIIKQVKFVGPYGFIVKPYDINSLDCTIEMALFKHAMDRRLKENEIRFRSLFENINSGVAIYKAVDEGNNFIFTDFNKTGEKIENIKREFLLEVFYKSFIFKLTGF